MYRANPRVNVELRQRLPSPAPQQPSNLTQQLSNSIQQLCSPDRSGTSLSLDHTDWPQAPHHLPEPPSSCSPSPLFYRRSVSPVSPVFHRKSVSPVSPVIHRRSASPVSPVFHRRSVSPLSSRPPGGAGQVEMELSPSRGPSPRGDSCGDGPDGGRASRGPGSPVLRRHLVSPDDSSHQEVTFGPSTASSRGPTFDRDKNISFLLKELDALRDMNKKDELVQKEKELQRREVEEELREEQREARDWERPAAVLEEVLAAQKDRDQALMSRLLLANEERDEALLRARQLQQAAELDGVHLEDTDMDVDELLRCICDADSVQEVEQFGSVLVQRLRLARQRRSDITAQEMKAVMEERDTSVAKCKRLEQEVIQEREQRLSEVDQLRLQRERGGALEDRSQMEAELQVLRASHSSQDLLTAPPSLHSDGISPADSLTAAHQAPPLQVQVQQLAKEKQSMEAELQRCQAAEREARERVRRLERLVEVLRKKVGTGNLRAVI
ncbi:mirror-image polydactyly gene 1 protein isoform X2 [Epinephelus fuscoguttatus]|uniref:mirror-image polydactyly gene 1 protein isoform X2 n=1 Tax=Epinephelus fuscoguttatus TaxID=293821 RepID=UPI0020D10AB6|nr:mirror-image polydactyly gene 1 protein isoform X2 [Epinephelus fuscoguttatus]